MSNGRIGVAPCNHRGEHIFGNYVKCLEGCDSVARAAAPAAVESVSAPTTPSALYLAQAKADAAYLSAGGVTSEEVRRSRFELRSRDEILAHMREQFRATYGLMQIPPMLDAVLVVAAEQTADLWRQLRDLREILALR